MVALMLSQRLEQEGLTVRIKWPNDLWLRLETGWTPASIGVSRKRFTWLIGLG